MKVYFDNAASTAVCEEAIKAMVDVMQNNYGNPSSMHTHGRNALGKLEEARAKIADALGAKADNVFLTSGGTEANNWAIRGALGNLARKHKGKHIITSATEHSAVLEPIKSLENEGWEVTYLSPDSSGRISHQDFADALRDDTVLASIMLVNNEMGAINPISEFAKEIKRRNLPTILHTDAVQGLCKIPFTAKQLGADLIAVSSHKLHGPKGVGALYAKDGVKLSPLIIGGKHEKGKRAGTEALPAAVGFGVATELGMKELNASRARVKDLKEYATQLIKQGIPDAVFIGETASNDTSTNDDRPTTHTQATACHFKSSEEFPPTKGPNDNNSPFLLCVSLPGYKSEVLMNYLDSVGVSVSKGSACKKGARSRTLEAMRLKNDVIDGALRISFSRYSTLEEVDYFVEKLKAATDSIISM